MGDGSDTDIHTEADTKILVFILSTNRTDNTYTDTRARGRGEYVGYEMKPTQVCLPSETQVDLYRLPLQS